MLPRVPQLVSLLLLAPLAGAQTVLYQSDFSDAAGWQLADCWNVDATPSLGGSIAHSGPTSLNCNNLDGGYDGCNDRFAISPAIDLSQVTTGAQASFWCQWITENDCTFDAKYFYVMDPSAGQIVFDLCMSMPATCPTDVWHQHTIPLDPSWGEVRLAFWFDAYDSTFNFIGGWMVDDLEVSGTCAPALAYCTPKVNSQGCTPAISTTGAPSASGSGAPFHVLASDVLNNHPGLLIWSTSQAATPFGGGTLCLGSPVIRTGGQASGGSSGPTDCSGSYSFAVTPAFLQANALTPGTQMNVQYWSRDTGFAAPQNIGLTAAMSFMVCE